MCCIIQIVMFVYGIVTLVKGNFSLASNRVVTGWPSVVVGLLLLLTLPLNLLFGIGYGFYMVMREEGLGDGEQLILTLVEFGVVVGTWIAIYIISSIYGRDHSAPPTGPNRTYTYQDLLPPEPPENSQPLPPPSDPNNPYSPPHTR